MGKGSYEVIALSAVHQTVHDVQDPEPQVEHAIPFGENHEIVEKDLAKQRRRLHPALAHADWIRLVDFRFEKLQYQRK